MAYLWRVVFKTTILKINYRYLYGYKSTLEMLWHSLVTGRKQDVVALSPKSIVFLHFCQTHSSRGPIFFHKYAKIYDCQLEVLGLNPGWTKNVICPFCFFLPPSWKIHAQCLLEHNGLFWLVSCLFILPIPTDFILNVSNISKSSHNSNLEPPHLKSHFYLLLIVALSLD